MRVERSDSRNRPRHNPVRLAGKATGGRDLGRLKGLSCSYHPENDYRPSGVSFSENVTMSPSALYPERSSTLNSGMGLSTMHLHSPIGFLVSGPAVHVASNDSLTLVSQVMRTKNVSAALVGPGHAAIITERDLTRALAAEYPPGSPVDRVATPLPLSVSSDTDILDAAALMLNQEVRHLTVEFTDGTVGIVSIRAIMAVLLQAAKPDVWLASLRLRVDVPTEMWLG